MQVRYRSQHVNEVHQLTIALSKHFYLRRDSVVLRQKKPFEVDLANCATLDRVHLVNYIVRDHFSGAFYATIARSDKLRNADEFLFEAWSKKVGHAFDGVPKLIVIAKSFLQIFPQLPAFLEKNGVKTIEATSGFQAGVRDVRIWEETIRAASLWIDLPGCATAPAPRDLPFDEMAANTIMLSRRASLSLQDARLAHYLNNRPPCRYPALP